MIKAVYDTVNATYDTMIARTARYVDRFKQSRRAAGLSDVWYKARCPNVACGTKYYLTATELFAIPADSSLFCAFPTADVEHVGNDESENLGAAVGDAELMARQPRSLECPHCHAFIRIDPIPHLELESSEGVRRNQLPTIDQVEASQSSGVPSWAESLLRSVPWLNGFVTPSRCLKTWRVIKAFRSRLRRAIKHGGYQITVVKISALVTVFSFFLVYTGIETSQLKKSIRQMLLGKPRSPIREVKLATSSERIISPVPTEAQLCAMKWLDETYRTLRIMDVIRDPQSVETCFIQWEMCCWSELKTGIACPALVRTMSTLRNELQRVVEILQEAPTDPQELEEAQLVVLEVLLDSRAATDRLADSMSIAFEAAHGSNRFEQACLDFLSESRKSYEFLRAQQVPSKLLQDNTAMTKAYKSSLRNKFAIIPPKSKRTTNEEKQVNQVFLAAISALDAYESMFKNLQAEIPRDSSRAHPTSTKAFNGYLRNWKHVLQKAELAFNMQNLPDESNEERRDYRWEGLGATAAGR